MTQVGAAPPSYGSLAHRVCFQGERSFSLDDVLPVANLILLYEKSGRNGRSMEIFDPSAGGGGDGVASCGSTHP